MPGELVWKLESCAWGTDYVKVNSLGFHLKERGTCCKKKKKKKVRDTKQANWLILWPWFPCLKTGRMG